MLRCFTLQIIVNIFILLRINWSTQAAFQQDSFNLNNPFKVSIRNYRERCEICSGLTIKTPERRQ